MTDQELKQIAIDYYHGHIDIFQLKPMVFEYKAKSSSWGLYFSNRSLTLDETEKFEKFFEQYKLLLIAFKTE